jgi:hypothetical protein
LPHDIASPVQQVVQSKVVVGVHAYLMPECPDLRRNTWILLQMPAHCQRRDKTPAILPVLPTRAAVSLGGDAVGTLQ